MNDQYGVGDDAVAVESGNSDLIADPYGYFGIAKDVRKCAFPMCGGWFLTSLNRSATRCPDGRDAASCYTPVLDWSAAGLPEDQQGRLLAACEEHGSSAGVYAIVHGRFARSDRATANPEPGRFVISEAWLAEGDMVSRGSFVRLADNGVRCVAAPCPSITETSINLGTSTDIAGIDWTPAKLQDEQIAECVENMSTPDGLLVAGSRYTVTGEAGAAPGRIATAAYYRLTDAK